MGRVELFRHESVLLADNPLGDSPTREVGVYLPDSYDRKSRRYPVILMLSGYTGTGLALCNRSPWTLTFDQRLDRLMSSGKAAEAIFVLPDCFTRYGGSQYVDSPAIGRYESYLCDELMPLIDSRYRTVAAAEGRGVIGKSSGGYGALRFGMRRPDLFSALGSHAGDSAFDLSYLRELPRMLLTMEKRGGIDGFLSWFDSLINKSQLAIEVMSNLCCAAAWSPKAQGPYGYGKGFDLPFEFVTCRLREEVWARWLAADPVRMLDEDRYISALRKSRAIFLDAGLGDEYNLQLGTRQIAAKLARSGIACVHEEFEGGHFNTAHRFDRSVEVITKALAG